MITEKTEIRVRYGEVDRMGYLHHGVYLLYFEQGRTDLIRRLGISYREIEDRGYILPVHDIKIRYLLPARYDEVVVVTTRLSKKPAVRFEFEYQVHNENGDLLCEATALLVLASRDSGKPVRMPDFFETILAEHFN